MLVTKKSQLNNADKINWFGNHKKQNKNQHFKQIIIYFKSGSTLLRRKYIHDAFIEMAN